MRSRLPILVLLASALVFLASLYLPWRSSNAGGAYGGWVSIQSDAAALLALAIVAASAAALRRPLLVARLPFGGFGVGLAYFAAAAAVQMDSAFGIPPNPGVSSSTGSVVIHYGWAYGVFLGVGSGTVAGLAALVLRRRELFRHQTALDAAAALLGLGLLASYLMPWFMIPAHGPAAIGLDTGPAMIAAAGILLCAGWYLAAPAPLRLGVAGAAAVLTGAAAAGLELSVSVDRFGKWLGVGCAVALVALEAARARPSRLPAAPRRVALRAGTAVLLLVALFLPAVDYHLPKIGIVATGWQTTSGATAGALALLLLATPLLPRLESYTLDATLAIALLVATLGIFWADVPVPALRFGYGAYVAFTAAALLLLPVLPRRRPVRVERGRGPIWILPLAASAACLAAILLPLWNVLPLLWTFQATAVQGWFSMAALLMTVYLAHSWLLRLRGSGTEPHRLTLVPLALLVLPALQLVRYRDVAIVWGGVILVALCLLLALLGWVEEGGGGLERFRMPELLRVDRLPDAEA